jgi:hypothetical protein
MLTVTLARITQFLLLANILGQNALSALHRNVLFP